MPLPKSLVKDTLHWYQTMLCHPGETQLRNTSRQHFSRRNMCQDVKMHVRHCDTCQKREAWFKRTQKMPSKDTETEPCRDSCIDLSGPWKGNI